MTHIHMRLVNDGHLRLVIVLNFVFKEKGGRDLLPLLVFFFYLFF